MKKKDSRTPRKKIIITGGGGYIGSHLCRILLQEGHEVTVLDRFLFGRHPIQTLEYFYPESFRIVEGDIRNEAALTSAFQHKDVLIHLAAIVGDPACSVRADEAVATNYDATVRIADIADSLGIARMIFSSTCSVYGSTDGWFDETSPTAPISLYGQTKLNAEEYLLGRNFTNLEVTILRLGTVFGLSPRMRFDLVVNYLTRKAIIEKQIKILGGNQWRPFVHVRDVATAMERIALLEDWASMAGRVTNVGSDAGNTMIGDLSNVYKEVFPELVVLVDPKAADRRSYRVKFSQLFDGTGFKPSITLLEGISEITSAFWDGTIVDSDRKEYYNYRVWT